MCLSVPAKILSINGDRARVSLGGAEYNAALNLVDDVIVGDYVLLHSGFAIQKIDEEEAMETMRLLNEVLEKEKEDENETGHGRDVN
ncbi:HypC/HybG/HupF family hydrogenase formation chaperone [Prolixibacteraceae bacterium Z1-6]|uniref:HypC/HybG/HupF family hydrogenase formation chaperone n=1 Tax=Draconibacterium aestuarii TaxID=2998507 RepID=A0A9X3F795_9BACT|nr:HypC/HybG/HupF family hydrogenase formation chaperone [Prolixibacteraceae bacterium Z1-6]